MLIAQITDSHVLLGSRIAARFDTAAAFQRLLESLRRQEKKPDLILFSGDLGEDATPQEYAFVGAGLRGLEIPVLAVPGNHDAREPLWEALPDMLGRTDAGHLCVARDIGPLVVVGLDTIVPSAAHGEICPARLAWLRETLKSHAGRDVLIFQHHPPIDTGLDHLDSMGILSGREEFAGLVAEHGRVAAILCGHVHRSVHGTCGGAPVRVSPSASHQFAFDLRKGEPYRFSDEPAQFSMHLWREGRGLVSHVVPVATG
ncbi:phosphodiesterase [Mesorhizobium marinum]|uniref:phosphodiesterase n=1 Tax=Mesorhizobium marinum TaxID=3228790 RepID=UPI003464FA61